MRSQDHDRLFLSPPHLGRHELNYVHKAIEDNWVAPAGPNITGFEADICLATGVAHCVALSSGTAAIHLGLILLGVGPGDEVLCPSFTFVATANPIVYLGATPVFVDSERESGNVDAALVAEYLRGAAARGELPKAFVAVHLYGQHADVDAIAAACAEYGVPLVEDAAESLGATYRGRPTATTAAFSILSFNGNKMITTTGGGMVVSRDSAALARMQKWANQSREPAVEYLHRELGYNYRMSNVLAGIGRGQLSVLDERVTQRRRVFARYEAALGDLDGVTFQAEAPWGTHSRWLTVAYLDPEVHPRGPRALVDALAASNIEARPVWRPMHTQPMFADAARVGGRVAESLYATGVCLPSSSSLTEAAQTRVIDAAATHLVAALAAR
jgi:pyridoxal phosphate-dependent aminotransferase EpsN